MDFVALDIERLDNVQESLCEVGMVKYENGICTGEFHAYVKPRIGFERNFWAKKYLRHITDNVLNGADDFTIVYESMKAFVSGLPIVCYSKGADLNTIYVKEKECGVSGLYKNYIDVYDI